MFGMGTIITSKSLVGPGGLWYGNPGRSDRKNVIGLERNEIDDKELKLELVRQEFIRQERSKYKYE